MATLDLNRKRVQRNIDYHLKHHRSLKDVAKYYKNHREAHGREYYKHLEDGANYAAGLHKAAANVYHRKGVASKSNTYAKAAKSATRHWQALYKTLDIGSRRHDMEI